MYRFLSASLICCLMSLSSFAGIISGKIVDKESGEILTGAVIAIEGTSFRNMSGLDGSFTIKNIPVGKYRVTVHMVGYKLFSAEAVVTDTQEGIVNIQLESEHSALDAITVTGKSGGTSDQAARHIERTASQVMNVISGRTIEISPDLTVANVIQRVSGVSIERNSNGDGQYAILRGMDKRYNYTLVNGVKIPSPDNKYRYVPLDIFPSDMLARLEVYKALTPAMEGDAVGGAVNMVMKDAPTRLAVTANIATGYSELFMDRDFRHFNSGSVNFKSPYERNGSTYRATLADFPAGTATYTSGHPLPNLVAGLSIGNSYLNQKLGILLAGSFQNTYRGSNSLFFNAEEVDTVKGVSLTSMSDRKYSDQQQRYGVHGRVNYQLSKNSRINWYNAFMNLTNIQLRDTRSISFSSGGYDPVKGEGGLGFSTRSRLTRQQIYNSTLQGEHTITSRLQLDWSAVYSRATNQQPDNTTISLNGRQGNFVDTITTVDKGTRQWIHNTDRDLAGYLNVTYHTNVAGIPVEWKAGGLYRDKKRSSFYNSYNFSPNPNVPTQYFGKGFTDNTQISWLLTNPEGSVASGNTYDAWEKISSGYLQFKTSGKKLELTGGVRVEHTDQGYSMPFPIGESRPNDSQVYTDVLPSLLFRYMPAARTNIRASYFRSVNRPGFAEINPSKIVNEEYTEKGDPDLKHAVIDNLDLRYELFPHASEQFMAGVFYKHISNPIEFTLRTDKGESHGNLYYMPGNFGNANNYGAELDWTRYFNKIGIRANYTYTRSRITTPKVKRIRNGAGDLALDSVSQTRPLYGQSAHIANLSLLYKDVKNGWDAQLAAGYTGPRISTVAQFLDNDIWQKGFLQLDASVEKSLKSRVVLFAKANNLLNTATVLFIKNTSAANNNKPNQDLKGETLMRRDYFQRSYLLGVRYKF